MKANEAISKLMKEKRVTQVAMAKFLGLKAQNRVAMRLTKPNMTADSIIEMLDVLGYELVIQPRKPGKRPEGQIVVEHTSSKEEE